MVPSRAAGVDRLARAASTAVRWWPRPDRPGVAAFRHRRRRRACVCGFPTTMRRESRPCSATSWPPARCGRV